MVGGERIVGDDDGQPGAVDEALDNPPLAINQGKEVGATVQEDEGSARAQTLLREHAGYAPVARRRETRSHRRRHRVGLWGVGRHIARGFFGVQRGRREPLAGVNETHLEGHGASFALSRIDKRFLFASGRARAPARTRIRREEGSLLTASVHRSYREETPVVVGAGG